MCLLLFILVLEMLNRYIKQDERIVEAKILKETSKAFADDLVFALEDLLKAMNINEQTKRIW